MAEPIPDKVWVEVEDTEIAFWQPVELGKLPKFCSNCKIVGHSLTDCSIVMDAMAKQIQEDNGQGGNQGDNRNQRKKDNRRNKNGNPENEETQKENEVATSTNKEAATTSLPIVETTESTTKEATTASLSVVEIREATLVSLPVVETTEAVITSININLARCTQPENLVNVSNKFSMLQTLEDEQPELQVETREVIDGFIEQEVSAIEKVPTQPVVVSTMLSTNDDQSSGSTKVSEVRAQNTSKVIFSPAIATNEASAIKARLSELEANRQAMLKARDGSRSPTGRSKKIQKDLSPPKIRSKKSC
ncbi:hypothetical protein FRX31_015027 [Thalictrum thalictroides]|uniref:Zinc knuckle (CCHC-type) family protein n=1 Tax=Thalictrum thalictroides TaxID=46969 RepID=A0A7J6WES7_THATH|nr:hypothetical protein FRX31_015027 [Thalictrum thalictroides]